MRALRAALVAVVLAYGSCATATTLYVAPDGNDSWSGKIARVNAAHSDGPLRSLDGARNAVRALNASSALNGPTAVLFEDGVYQLTEPVVFSPGDSGTENAPITFGAAPGAHPIFSGGRIISGWAPAGPGLWRAQVADVAAGHWYFEQLWLNGRRAVRSRIPARNYFYSVQRAHVADEVGSAIGEAPLNLRAFRGRPQDIGCLSSLTAQELHDVTAVIFQSWESSHQRIKNFNPKTNTLFFGGTTLWGFFNYRPLQRYYLENLRQGLTEPGEWFLSRSGELLYKPLPGETIGTSTAVAPSGLDQFVQIKGLPSDNKFVEHLRFQGLSFRVGQYVLPDTGHSSNFAESDIPYVVVADGARDVDFDDCEIAHIGSSAIWLRDGCTHCKIDHCFLHDLGGCGIRIGNTDNPASDALATGNITIDNNIIHGVGRIHQGAAAISIGESGDNSITHNDIADTYETAIVVGWKWGYMPSAAKRNTIAFNHVHNVGQYVLGDLGGIYTLGMSEGTIIENNHVHDVYSYSNGGSGIYNDEGSSGITVLNNLVHDTTWGYLQNYGHNDVVSNNIFAYSRYFGINHPNSSPPKSVIFDHNIVYDCGNNIFCGEFGADMPLSDNVYWDRRADVDGFAGLNFDAWRNKGYDQNSVISDPLFMDPEQRIFSLRPDSPALAHGFQPIDISQAGIYGDKNWTALAAKLNHALPVLQEPPDEPDVAPVVLHQTFQDMPVGAQPDDCNVQLSYNGDSVGVTSDTAASGTHSVKVVSGVGPANDFHPIVIFSPYFKVGRASISFDIRLEAETAVDIECRDWPNDINMETRFYRTGPELAIKAGVIYALGRPLMYLPTDQWIHIAMSCGVGDQQNGVWDASVSIPGKSPQVFSGLEIPNPQFKELDWFAFHNMAPGPSTYYFDNVDLLNTR